MSEAVAEESPAQRAARLRREKREKKILDGGSNRLARITNVSGREEDLQPAPPPKPNVSSDPGDVDIPHIPSALSPRPSDADAASQAAVDADLARLREAFRAQSPGTPPTGSSSFPSPPSGADSDPMAQLMAQMQQMLGLPAPPDGSSSGPGDPGISVPNSSTPGGAGPELPPALASLLSGQGFGAGGNVAKPVAAPPAGAYLWRIAHALFAVGLAVYVLTTLPFTGAKTDRLGGGLKSAVFGEDEEAVARQRGVFWIFATAELGLQSTRLLMERGREPQGGMVATVAGFLPEPYKGYLLLALRYGAIWTRLVEDAMVIVFVVGMVAWWKGAGA